MKELEIMLYERTMRQELTVVLRRLRMLIWSAIALYKLVW